MYFKLSFFLTYFLFGSILCSFGQEKFTFSNSQIRKELKSIFAHDKRLDSFHLIIRDNNLSGLKVFGNTDLTTEYHNEIELTSPVIYRQFSFYDLSFEGDLFFLKKDFPDIYQFVGNAKLKEQIKTVKENKFFVISVTPRKNYLIEFGQDFMYAALNLRLFEDFIKELNLQYSSSKPIVKDSILIIQAVVNKSGRISDPAILYGSNSEIYRHFFKTYEDYNDKFFPYNKRPYDSLIRPFLKDGTPMRSLIDIYLKLNSDDTFTVSGSGKLRKLKIPNFKNDPNNPVWIF